MSHLDLVPSHLLDSEPSQDQEAFDEVPQSKVPSFLQVLGLFREMGEQMPAEGNDANWRADSRGHGRQSQAEWDVSGNSLFPKRKVWKRILG